MVMRSGSGGRSSGMHSKSPIRGHEDLEVWRLAIDLAVATVKATETLPSSERFGLVGQMRRAAFSVASNIAEGAGQGTRKGYAHFLAVARGSMSELRTGLLIAYRCDWLSAEGYQALDVQARRGAQMLTALRRSIAGSAVAHRRIPGRRS